MAEHITYKFSSLDECSLKMADLIKNTEFILSQFNNESSALADIWEGNGKSAFDERADRFKGAVEQLRDELTVSKEKLDKSAALSLQDENSRVRAVGQLTDENIF